MFTDLPLFSAMTIEEVRDEYQRFSAKMVQLRQINEEINTLLYQLPDERPTINSPADAAAILSGFLEPLDHEELWIVNMNTRNAVINLGMLSRGSVNKTSVRVGECFREAIIRNASAILVAHNHPSGDPTPSPEDVSVTRAIVEAGKLLDITVTDHLVIGRGRYTSLKEKGLGFS